MSTNANRATIRRLYELLSARDYTSVDEIVAPDTVFNGQLVGVEGYRQLITMPRAAFPDFQNTPEEYLAEGDRVVVRWSARGTHLAPLRGLPPTGRRIAVRGIDIFRLVDGRVAESWEVVDRLGMMQQLGVVPGGAPAGDYAPEPAHAGRDERRRSGNTDENKTLVRRFYDGLNRGDAVAVSALVSADLTYNGEVIGREGAKLHVAATRGAFPDLNWSIEDMISEGDSVATRYTYGGTHQGELMGIPPTGKTFRAAGIAIDRIVDGQIAEEWEVRDTFGALQQLGVIPDA